MLCVFPARGGWGGGWVVGGRGGRGGKGGRGLGSWVVMREWVGKRERE